MVETRRFIGTKSSVFILKSVEQHMHGTCVLENASKSHSVPNERGGECASVGANVRLLSLQVSTERLAVVCVQGNGAGSAAEEVQIGIGDLCGGGGGERGREKFGGTPPIVGETESLLAFSLEGGIGAHATTGNFLPLPHGDVFAVGAGEVFQVLHIE